MEVTSHHLAALQASRAFDYTAGPVGGKLASKKVRALLGQLLENPDDEVTLFSLEARYSSLATCKRNDVVLVKDGRSYRVGKVLLHASVLGVPFYLVSLWSLRSIHPGSAYAKWNVMDDCNVLIQTSDILDTVCHTRIHGNVVTTLLPLQLR